MDFIDFLYQMTPKAQDDKKRTIPRDAVEISDSKNLKQLLSLMTMEGDIPIHVRIGHQIFDYHSFLKLDMTFGFEAQTNLYLVIDALDPAIGNLRIRKSDSVTVRMNTKRYNLEFEVVYIETIGRNVLKLSFPETLLIRTEKRASVRVTIDSKWGIQAIGTRDAGLTFPLKMINISSGGLYFQPVGELPQLSDGGHVAFQFSWKSQNIVCTTHSTIIERISWENTAYYRCRFVFEQYDSAMRDLESLVATTQLLQIQRRRELFTDFKMPC